VQGFETRGTVISGRSLAMRNLVEAMPTQLNYAPNVTQPELPTTTTTQSPTLTTQDLNDDNSTSRTLLSPIGNTAISITVVVVVVVVGN
jgi:hypothetical protein